MLPLTFSERVHLPRIPFITLPCTFAPASAVSAPTLAGGGGERAETEGELDKQARHTLTYSAPARELARESWADRLYSPNTARISIPAVPAQAIRRRYRADLGDGDYNITGGCMPASPPGTTYTPPPWCLHPFLYAQ